MRQQYVIEPVAELGEHRFQISTVKTLFDLLPDGQQEVDD